jgi:hypothetical protein
MRFVPVSHLSRNPDDSLFPLRQRSVHGRFGSILNPPVFLVPPTARGKLI